MLPFYTAEGAVVVVVCRLRLPPRLLLLSFFHTACNFGCIHIRERDLVAQPIIAAATAAVAEPFPDVVTLRAYRP